VSGKIGEYMNRYNTEYVLRDLRNELEYAERKPPDTTEYHQGYSRIREELDKLGELVQKKEATPEQHYLRVMEVMTLCAKYAKLSLHIWQEGK
jgi:hypothetical protein